MESTPMNCGEGRRLKIVSITISISVLICLTACIGRPGQTPILGGVTIELATTSAVFPPTVTPGGTISVSATVFDPNNAGVTWTATPLDFGSLTNPTSNSVTFTAPSSFSTSSVVTVTATSVTNPNVSASVQFAASPIRILLVAPGTQSSFFIDVPMADQTISPGGTMDVKADIAYDSRSNGVNWSLSPADAGSLTVQFNGPINYIVT